MFRKQLVCLLLIFSLLTSFSFATVYDKEGVMNEIYNHASNFESSFTIDYKGELEPLGDLLKLLETTLDYDDYISKGISRYGISYESVDNNATITITVSLGHYMSPENEKAVDQYVEETLKQLHLEGQSDYVRAKSIMSFIDDHFSYDKDLIIRDPYTMIVSQKGVCQAYALLFYKMAKGAGLQVRTQEGTVQDGAHLWNLVKINDTWFHVDPTNTHFNKNSDFFLKGNQYFLNKSFTWTTLVEPVVDGNEAPDQNFTSGNYSESNIKDYLKQNIKVYVESQVAKEAREAHEVLLAQHEALKKALANLLTNPSKETFKELTSISNAMTDPSSAVEADVKNALINAHNTNLLLLSNTYKSYSDRIQLLKANATEQNKLNMIKIGKETITVLKTSAYEDTSLNAYLPAINANNRTVADSLTRQYIANAEKTKNKTYKDKAIALAKEYNFKDLLAKASKLKVK